MRLPSEDEYLELIQTPGNSSKSNADDGKKPLCSRYTPLDQSNGDRDFGNIGLKFISENMVWEQSSAGLRFLISPDFGEWLNEKAAAVNTYTRDSLCYPGFRPTKGLFAAHSTGKYKGKKVGFRLCYVHGSAESPASPTVKK